MIIYLCLLNYLEMFFILFLNRAIVTKPNFPRDKYSMLITTDMSHLLLASIVYLKSIVNVPKGCKNSTQALNQS